MTNGAWEKSLLGWSELFKLKAVALKRLHHGVCAELVLYVCNQGKFTKLEPERKRRTENIESTQSNRTFLISIRAQKQEATGRRSLSAGCRCGASRQ